MEKLKRTLIIDSDIIGDNTGAGILKECLFSDFPKENIMQISLKRSKNVENIIYINPIQAPVDFIVRPFLTFIRYRLIKKDNGFHDIHPAIGQTNIAGKIHDFFRGLLDSSPIFIGRKLKKKIKTFSPDIIYSMLGNIRTMKLAIKIGRLTGCPVIPHFMDNWPETMYSSGVLSLPFKHIMNKYIKKLIKYSVLGIAISPRMAREYENKYGIRFEYIFNGGEIKKDVITENNYASRYNDLTFVYCGGLHLQRWKSLLDIADVLKLNQRSKLLLYVPKKDRILYEKYFNEYKGVCFHSEISSSKVMDVLSDADILVFVESFDKKIEKFIKYSLSTKIPQYLCACKPIICYAPIDIGSTEILKSSGAAITITSRRQLYRAINQVIYDEKIRKVLSENARMASVQFTRKKMREKFTSLINGINRNFY